MQTIFYEIQFLSVGFKSPSENLRSIWARIISDENFQDCQQINWKLRSNTGKL